MGTVENTCRAMFRTAFFTAFTLFICAGGGKRDRTADLLHAMQALSQLSYTPNFPNACLAPFNISKTKIIAVI